MKLDIIECKKCGVLFSSKNESIKSIYKKYEDMGYWGYYLDCPICKYKTIIWKDWAIDTEFLNEKFGEENYYNPNDD